MTSDSLALPGSTRIFLLARGLALVAAVVGAVLAARLLGPEARGSLGIFVFCVTLGAAALGIGLPTALYDLVRRDRTSAHAAIRAGRSIAIAAGLIGAAVLFLIGVTGWTAGAFDAVDPILVALAAGLGIAGMLATQAHTMAHVALGATGRAALAQAVPSLFVALGYITGLWVFGAGLGGAIFGFALGQVAAAVVTGRSSRDVAGVASPSMAPAVRNLVQRGIRVELSDVANVLSYRIDILLLAALAGLASLGRYSVGVQLLEPMWVMGSALAMSIMATAASPEADESLHASVATAVRISVLVCVAGGLLASVLVALIGPYVLGPGFETVPVVMITLIPGIAAIGASKVLAGAVIGRGGIGIGSFVATMTVGCNVLLNLILVPRFAELGAALSSSIAYGVSTALWLRAWRGHGGALYPADLIPRAADVPLLIRSILRASTP